MFCRRALQRVGPLARCALKPTTTSFFAAPVRHMAFGIPGGSSNLTYLVLCGGGLAAAVYTYKAVNGDGPAKAPEAAPEAAAPAAEPAPVAKAVSEPTPAPAEPTPEPVPEPFPVEAAAEPVAEAAPEPAPEPVAAAEVVDEPAPEPVAETVAEPVAEAMDEPAPAPEVVVEAPAEVAPATEEPAPAAVEAAPAEAPVEAPAQESVDVHTAVKIVEIAAASVGDTNLVQTMRQTEDEEVIEHLKEANGETGVVYEEEEKTEDVSTATDAEEVSVPATEESTQADNKDETFILIKNGEPDISFLEDIAPTITETLDTTLLMEALEDQIMDKLELHTEFEVAEHTSGPEVHSPATEEETKPCCRSCHSEEEEPGRASNKEVHEIKE